MPRRISLPSLAALLFLFVAFACVPGAFARELSNHTAKFVQTSPDMGPADPSQVITVKVHLKGQNQDQLSAFIQQLHDPTSPNFQKWLTPDQFKAQFGATAGTAGTVQTFLTGHNLKIVSSDSRSITVQGTVGDVQSALHTRIDQFQVNGNVVRANVSNPIVDEPAGAMVTAVSGLTDVMAKPHSVMARDAQGNPREPVTLDVTANPDGRFFPSNCLTGDGSVSITDGVNTAAYTGQVYRSTGCAFQPSELAVAYNFNALYSQGLNGAGQTIVIVDAFGSPTLTQDVNLFNALYGLPPAQISTFLVNVTGVPIRQNAGFAGETTLDV